MPEYIQCLIIDCTSKWKDGKPLFTFFLILCFGDDCGVLNHPRCSTGMRSDKRRSNSIWFILVVFSNPCVCFWICFLSNVSPICTSYCSDLWDDLLWTRWFLPLTRWGPAGCGTDTGAVPAAGWYTGRPGMEHSSSDWLWSHWKTYKKTKYHKLFRQKCHIKQSSI